MIIKIIQGPKCKILGMKNIILEKTNVVFVKLHGLKHN
jgi:hypothetical protein